MSDEMLFTVAGSIATPAQMISLAEAGLEERSDLEQWLLANPEILGPGVKVVSFEFERRPMNGRVVPRDRLDVLGLCEDGRLVVAELHSASPPDVAEMRAIRNAAMASRFLPESLAEHLARFRTNHRYPMSTDEALAELQVHAPELSVETLRRPRIVLIARDFPPAVTASVVWLSEMGLDVSLVQMSAYLSYVHTHGGGESVPMISVSQLYPVRDVEDFAVSPERQRARELDDAKKRVQDETIVLRLVGAESVADGTIFTISPRNDISFDQRDRVEEWLDADPVRRTAHWQNRANGPLVWDADKTTYSPSALVRHIVEEATGTKRDFLGSQWWRDPGGWTLVELASPLHGGKGAVYREFWAKWLDRVKAQHGPWTQMSTPTAQNWITMPSPIRGTRYGLSFAAGGRLRSELYIDYGHQEANVAQLHSLQAQSRAIEEIYGAELSWEELPERIACRIADYGVGEITKVEDHEAYIEWMISSQERLRTAINGSLNGHVSASSDSESDSDPESDRDWTRR
jgi:hypothetical protein